MAKIKDIFTLQMGKTPARAKAEYYESGTNKWVSISDLSTYGKYVGDTKEKLTDIAVKESGIKPVPANTVIMSFKLSIGKTALTREPTYTNEAIMAFIPNHPETVIPDYLYYVFSGRDWENGSNRAVMGATLNKATLGEMEIDIPSIRKQQHIAAVLDKVSELIDLRKQQLNKLDEMVKARFVEMFGDPIRNTQNWPTTEVINVVKMQRGFDLPVQDRQQDGDIPVYGSNGALGHHNVAKVTGGGIITGRSGTIGKVFYTDGDYWPLNTSLFSIDTHGNNVIFLAKLLELFDLSRFVEGTGVPTLNRNMFHTKQIIDVSIEEQNEFASFVKQLDKSKAAVQKSLDNLQVLFDSLMQEYFG